MNTFQYDFRSFGLIADSLTRMCTFMTSIYFPFPRDCNALADFAGTEDGERPTYVAGCIYRIEPIKLLELKKKPVEITNVRSS